MYKIKDKDGNLVTFKPRGAQLRHLAERGTLKRNRILKYRQGGFTTLYCIDELDDSLWLPGFSTAVIAHEREALDKIFQIIERAHDNLPESLKPITRQDTLRMLRFEKTFDGQPLDSSIYVAMKLRGGTVQSLHITERSAITGVRSQELEAGSKQAVPISGRITEESTANGMNEYYDSFTASWRKDGLTPLDFHSYFYAWHEEEEYQLPGIVGEYTPADLKLMETVRRSYSKELTDEQILWYRWKLKQLSEIKERKDGLRPEQLMKQEFPSDVNEAFQSGAGFVFDIELVEAIVPKKPLRVWENTTIWVEPEEGHKYIVGCDPSDGAVDYGVIDVWDAVTCEQVAQFAEKLRPDELAEKIRDIAVYYNKAFVGVENNQLSTILFLSKIYDNIYFTMKIDERTQSQTKKLGWSTNSKSRDLMIDEFIIAFEDGSLKVNSELTRSEMRTFIRKDNGKREHADGKHDDSLFAGFIAWQMRKSATRSIMDFYRAKAAESGQDPS